MTPDLLIRHHRFLFCDLLDALSDNVANPFGVSWQINLASMYIYIECVKSCREYDAFPMHFGLVQAFQWGVN